MCSQNVDFSIYLDTYISIHGDITIRYKCVCYQRECPILIEYFKLHEIYRHFYTFVPPLFGCCAPLRIIDYGMSFEDELWPRKYVINAK